MICEICRENHEPARGLSFDGAGVNSCGMYRTRIATFGPDAKNDLQALGRAFAAAPEMLTALQMVARRYTLQEDDAEEVRAAIAKAEGGA